MNEMRRSTFLKRAGAAVTGTAALMYPGVVQAASSTRGKPRTASSSLPGATAAGKANGEQVVQLSGPDLGYAEGEVVAKRSDGIVLSSSGAARAIRVPPGTVVWKEFDVTVDAIEIGDWVAVRGNPLPDGTLRARSGWIWVNIGRRDGTIRAISKAQVHVEDGHGNVRPIDLSARLDVIHAGDGSLVNGQIAGLRSGQHVGAVGLLLPSGGFRATRIWLNS